MLGRPIFRFRNTNKTRHFVLGLVMCSIGAPNAAIIHDLFIKHKGALDAILNDPMAIPWMEPGLYDPSKGEMYCFQLNLDAMRAQARPFAEEIAARVFHPRRVIAWEAQGIDVAQDM